MQVLSSIPIKVLETSHLFNIEIYNLLIILKKLTKCVGLKQTNLETPINLNKK